MDAMEAQERVLNCSPVWIAVDTVREVTGIDRRIVFHAGPPFAHISEIPTPVFNSLATAVVYEEWVEDFDVAHEDLLSGRIETAAAQDHRLLVPLAGVLSPSMSVLTVADRNNPAVRMHCAINEGNVHATRFGKVDPYLPQHLRWLNGPFAHWLRSCLTTPIALIPLIRQALAQGDDGHARTIAGSKLVMELLLFRKGGQVIDQEVETFLRSSPAFALSLWMAMSALCLRQAERANHCAIVTRVGGNGRTFGIQLANDPESWITIPAPVPAGINDAQYLGKEAIGALGDSAVVDFFGLGGQSLRSAPALQDALAQSLPPDALDRPMKCLGPGRADMGLAYCATNAKACSAAAAAPLVLIGMIDAAGEAGRIGGGVIDVSVNLFRKALM